MSLQITLTESGQAVYQDTVSNHVISLACEARVYGPVWKPEDFGITRVDPIRDGLRLLESPPGNMPPLRDPARCGLLMAFLRDLLVACEKHPKATVEASA